MLSYDTRMHNMESRIGYYNDERGDNIFNKRFNQRMDNILIISRKAFSIESRRAKILRGEMHKVLNPLSFPLEFFA